MSRFGELITLFLQETEETERSNNPIVDLLTERAMDDGGGGGGGGGGRLRRRRSLQQRLGLKSIVCCGSTWGFGASAITTQAHNDDEIQNDVVVGSSHQQIDAIAGDLTLPEITSDPDCTFPSPRMNLAAALAAERQFRSNSGDGAPPETVAGGSTEPLKLSLMRLLEEGEMDGQDEEIGGVGTDQMCCVCMGRKKGAALIPCGHTFCRVCCRELWLNRGSCPLCNRSILEILDIY